MWILLDYPPASGTWYMTRKGDLEQTLAAVRARLTQDGALDSIRRRIHNEKTLNSLYYPFV